MALPSQTHLVKSGQAAANVLIGSMQLVAMQLLHASVAFGLKFPRQATMSVFDGSVAGVEDGDAAGGVVGGVVATGATAPWAPTVPEAVMGGDTGAGAGSDPHASTEATTTAMTETRLLMGPPPGRRSA
jgi:hypothetical protein